MPFGVLVCLGDSPGSIKKATIKEFSYRLSLPYKPEPRWYKFRITFDDNVDMGLYTKEQIATHFIEAFDALIAHPDVTRRFGRLTYTTRQTTRSYIQRQTTSLLLDFLKCASESTTHSQRLTISES